MIQFLVLRVDELHRLIHELVYELDALLNLKIWQVENFYALEACLDCFFLHHQMKFLLVHFYF